MLAPSLRLLGAFTLSMGLASTALAQTPPPVAPDAPEGEHDPIEDFAWQESGAGKLGDRAEIAIPPGFRYLSAAEASRLVEAMGNITSHKELGLIGTRDLEWFVVFFFDDIGYVNEDEKDELDANEIADSIKESLEYSNEMRKERGVSELFFDGWSIEPRYNETTKQLEWANRLRSADGVSVNYNTRVLGRKGVMRVILVTDPELLDATLPKYRELMSGFKYTEGERYAEYRSGDKIAEYGLIALVAGGAGAVAAKTGLLTGLLLFLKKGAKLIVVGLVAIGAFIKKLFTGKSD
ncbi:MAG: DUF2167 domain-containing protein [Myxococcales bacterium]|nr:DUF2167 domain-containing protein [Myxococcales bacterium]MCB9652208.1 DUF2167 domain-containing protein [Deltaproteobacteria bacterium]